MGMLEGALRVMPAWQWTFLGHTVAWNVLIPALLPLGLVFTGAALWPFVERWLTGDKAYHNVNDRPRNAPTRTGVGMAVIAFYAVLWMEGANDLFAAHFDIPLYLTTIVARFAIFVMPVLAYIITKRICLGLQRKDVHLLSTAWRPALSGSCPVASSSRTQGRSTKRSVRSWYPGRNSLPCRQAAVTAMRSRRPACAAPRAGYTSGCTRPSPRACRCRTGPRTAMATGTRSRATGTGIMPRPQHARLTAATTTPRRTPDRDASRRLTRPAGGSPTPPVWAPW